MKSHEFIINIPINIKINGNEEPEISVPDDDPELHQNPVMVSPLQQELELAKAAQGKQNPVMVSPLQQELELAKAAQGKQSPVIDQITAPDNTDEEPAPNPDELKRLLQLARR